MPQKIYPIQLSAEDRHQLQRYVHHGTQSARAFNRARILLLADEQKTDEEIIEALSLSRTTIYRVRKAYNENGLQQVLQEKFRSGAPAKIDGRVEATLTLLACSDPPEGWSRWTLHLLADKLVELAVIDSISREAVRMTLKKTNSNRG